MTPFDGWENFYIIVGSSAGALIGLQFVVLTLIAERPPPRVEEAGAAFATPTIVHFSAVLLLSAIVSIPWKDIETPAILWGLSGVCGILYSLEIARRFRRQGSYPTVFEDWLFHVLLPLAAYVMLAISARAVGSHERAALLTLGVATLLLLFAGIHNAWDSITYHVLTRSREAHRPERHRKRNR